jgi:hypothetical protein
MGMASTTRIRIAFGAILLLLMAGWLSFGVFSDREFGELYVFVKHKPSLRFYFYSPMGESDYPPLSRYTPAQRTAEMAFREFVERKGGYRRSFCIGFGG